jgi:hypothetical protein
VTAKERPGYAEIVGAPTSVSASGSVSQQV